MILPVIESQLCTTETIKIKTNNKINYENNYQLRMHPLVVLNCYKWSFLYMCGGMETVSHSDIVQ